jgi:thiol-disulfide isomerase/thioredoxin
MAASLLLQLILVLGFTPDQKKTENALLHDRLLYELSTQSTPLFIKFHAPWCGFCKKLAPIWEELGQEYPKMLRSVDCTAEFSKPFCEKHSANGYPTLILFQNGVAKPEYDGDREPGALSAYLREVLEDGHPLLDPSAVKPGDDATVFIGFFGQLIDCL